MITGFVKIKNSLNKQQKYKGVGLSKWKIVTGYWGDRLLKIAYFVLRDLCLDILNFEIL